MQQHRSERGQTLVLIIFAIVALFAFAALAVDLGRVFAERRRAQSAADAAAFAAAMAPVHGEDWAAAALASTRLNDYVDPNPNENLDQPMDVQVYNPPISGPYKDHELKEEYFQVFIRSRVDPVFAHFIFPGLLESTVEAVARTQPIQALYSGDALAAVNSSACKAIWFQGNAGTYINGGNVFSNSDRAGDPSSCDAGVQNGSGELRVTNGEINSVGTFDSTTAVTATGGIHENSGVHKTLPDLGIPDCFNDPNFHQRTYEKLTGGDPGPNVLLPGYYENGIKVNAGEEVRLTSGMYCLEDDFTMNGGNISDIIDPATNRRGVFIVMLEGDFTIGGNVVVNLNRMNAFTDYSGREWHGMLLYMPYKSPWLNTGDIQLGGTGSSRYTGTILAPGPVHPVKEFHSGYKCTIAGNSGSIGLSSNVICNTIYVTGNATVKINYRPEQNHRLAPMIELSQ